MTKEFDEVVKTPDASYGIRVCEEEPGVVTIEASFLDEGAIAYLSVDKAMEFARAILSAAIVANKNMKKATETK